MFYRLSFKVKNARLAIMKVYVFRLKSGQDLKKEIDQFSAEKNIQAGVVISCVGNLKQVYLRMAGGKDYHHFNDPKTYEILSLVGTINSGYSHLHISISDNQGLTFGGHLKEGSMVGVTVEVIIGEIENYKFKREFDPETGYKELVAQEV